MISQFESKVQRFICDFFKWNSLDFSFETTLWFYFHSFSLSVRPEYIGIIIISGLFLFQITRKLRLILFIYFSCALTGAEPSLGISKLNFLLFWHNSWWISQAHDSLNIGVMHFIHHPTYRIMLLLSIELSVVGSRLLSLLNWRYGSFLQQLKWIWHPTSSCGNYKNVQDPSASELWIRTEGQHSFTLRVKRHFRKHKNSQM